MTRYDSLYDSDVALVLVLVVLGFLMWLPTDVYLRQAADDLCLQLGLLGLSESICLFHLLLASGPPKCDAFHLVDPRSALCSSASVTHRYLVTFRHDIPLPGCIARSQRITPPYPHRVTCSVHTT